MRWLQLKRFAPEGDNWFADGSYVKRLSSSSPASVWKFSIPIGSTERFVLRAYQVPDCASLWLAPDVYDGKHLKTRTEST
jgi:hypothetical protein